LSSSQLNAVPNNTPLVACAIYACIGLVDAGRGPP